MRRVITVALLLAVLLVGGRTAAEPLPELAPAPEAAPEYAELKSGPGELRIAGRVLVLPTGTRLLSPARWNDLDSELRRLQDVETRLTAENKTFRAEAPGWRPGWKTLLSATLTGFVGGVYAYHRFSN